MLEINNEFSGVQINSSDLIFFHFNIFCSGLYDARILGEEIWRRSTPCLPCRSHFASVLFDQDIGGYIFVVVC